MIATDKCPLCYAFWRGQQDGELFSGECSTCGWVQTTRAALEEIWSQRFQDGRSTGKGTALLTYRLSALCKRAAPGTFTIDLDHLQQLESGMLDDRPMSEKLQLALEWFSGKTTYAGEWLLTDSYRDYPAAACHHAGEWEHLLKLVAHELGLLEVREGLGPTGLQARVTLKGWDRLENRPRATGRTGFIAMAFSSDLAELHRAIHLGVAGAGYEPVRVDEEHYSGGVMDKVVATIRASRFVVADFTRNRSGVYYEAGFAAGLGVPVVHLCESRCMLPNAEDRIHFDVQHVNFLTWEKSKLADLTDRLATRLIALFGAGPAALR
jgi:hypothetical protein